MILQVPLNSSASILPHTIDYVPIALVIIALILGIAGLFLLRAITRSSSKKTTAFDRVVLQILVPKERKSEGQGGQVSQEDRLEHIKEEIGITETFFSTIAGLRAKMNLHSWLYGRDDQFAFEVVVHNQQISFYIDVPRRIQQFLEQQIHAQYPYAQIEEMTDYNLFTPKSAVVGAYLTSKSPAGFPFKTYKTLDSDPMSAVLNALARIHEHNSSAAIQFVIRSAPNSWRSQAVKMVREVKKGKRFEDVTGGGSLMKEAGNVVGSVASSIIGSDQKDSTPESYQLSAMEEEMLKGIEQKISKAAVEATIRVMSVSDVETVAKSNLDNIVNSFSQYNLYRFGNSFVVNIPRNQPAMISNFIYRSFNEKRRVILNTEELSSLWHLPLHSTEAPNVKWLQGRKSAAPAGIPSQGLLLGHVQYRGTDTKIHLDKADRRRHLYVIGKSGSGKSVTLANLIVQDIQAGHGVGVVDPHGDLVEAVLEHVPKHRADDVIIFDPSDMERPIGLNMLEAKSADQRDFAVQEMISIFYKLFPPEMIGPMFEHNMRNVMLTLMADLENPGTVIDIPRMFTDDNYVKTYLRKLKDPVVRAFWEKEMAKTSDFHKSEMLGYLISKVGRFVENETMRNIMGQQKSGFNFRDIMDQKKILLVNLAKGKTGEVNSKLLGLITVAKLQMAAMGRADMPEDQRSDFYLYIDEFQNFITDSIATILSEARKYRLNLTIAHQYMGQLVDDKGKTEIRDAVLGNVGTLMCGRIGPDDAEILAKEFAPTFGSYDLLNPPPYSFYTKLLVANETKKPFNMSAYPPVKGNVELAQALKQLSRLKYGRDRRIVEREILDRTKLGDAEGQAKTDSIEPSL